MIKTRDVRDSHSSRTVEEAEHSVGPAARAAVMQALARRQHLLVGHGPQHERPKARKAQLLLGHDGAVTPRRSLTHGAVHMEKDDTPVGENSLLRPLTWGAARARIAAR